MGEALRAGKPFHGAALNYRKNGERYPVEWTISPVTDSQGQVRYFISVQKDLSDLRRVMSRLKQTNQHFRAFLRDLEQVGDTGGGLAEVTGQKPQLTRALLDDLRQCDPAGYVAGDAVLFAEDDLFGLDEQTPEVADFAPPAAVISAADYAQQPHFGTGEISELLTSLQETRQQLDLLELSSNKAAELHVIADNLQELANGIFYLDDFIGLSTVLAELATRTRDSASADVPLFLGDIYRALLQDVETWINTVFVTRTARDIHELDNSIISSAKQLLMLLPHPA